MTRRRLDPATVDALDPEKLTPLAREVLAARDDMLRTLRALGDDRKAAMVLSYVAASLVGHLSAMTDQPVEQCLTVLINETYRSVLDGVMTAPFRLQ